MTIPNLPTDNLYKFVALSGLLIVLTSLVAPYFLLYDAHKTSKQVQSELQVYEWKKVKLESQKEDLLKQYEAFQKELDEYELQESEEPKIQRLKELLDNLKDEDFRNYFEFTIKYEHRIIPEAKLKAELNELESKIDKTQFELDQKLTEISALQSTSESTLDWIKSIKVQLLIALLIGSSMMTYGFRLWYTKVQKPLDEKLQLELQQLKKAVE